MGSLGSSLLAGSVKVMNEWEADGIQKTITRPECHQTDMFKYLGVLFTNDRMEQVMN